MDDGNWIDLNWQYAGDNAWTRWRGAVIWIMKTDTGFVAVMNDVLMPGQPVFTHRPAAYEWVFRELMKTKAALLSVGAWYVDGKTGEPLGQAPTEPSGTRSDSVPEDDQSPVADRNAQ